MSSPATGEPHAETTFICERGDSFLGACRGEPFYKEDVHEDERGALICKRYCVLHYPGNEKGEAFAEALRRKLEAKNFDFMGVWFPDVPPFAGVNFPTDTYFSYAVFAAGADFTYATFTGDAYFHYAEFRAAAVFKFADFKKVAYFRSAVFSAEADFEVAAFRGETDFAAVSFSAAADFGYTRIADYIAFSEEDVPAFVGQSSFQFQFANIDNPERVAFRAVTLRPHWFVHVDARKFDLSTVNWDWRGISLKRELAELKERELAELKRKGLAELKRKKKEADSPHHLLSVACRNLAVNAEENHRYEEASRFRYMAMDARRLEKWRGFAFWRLSWWYWLASGYGERILRALAVLVALWLGFAFLYSRAECTDRSLLCVGWEQKVSAPSPSPRESFSRSLAYTLDVMTLQKPEPRPASPAAHMLVTLCTILGPVQGALLALAIRRKFMR